MARFLLPVLLSALAFLPMVAFSQALNDAVKIEGTLYLGDTTQVIELHTRRGDVFLGDIQSFDGKSLYFKINTGDLLVFELSKIERIIQTHSSLASLPTGDLSRGIFILEMTGGSEHKGEVVSVISKGVRFRSSTLKGLYVDDSEFRRIRFEPIPGEIAYPNYYILKRKGGPPFKGHLVNISNQYLSIVPEGEDYLLAFPREEVAFVTGKKPYSPMTGYQHSLLLAPTGFNLHKGKSEYRNINLYINSFSIGLNDHISGTIGAYGIEPYIQIKLSNDFSPILHVSVGIQSTLQGLYGWEAAASIGTPDYFLNAGYMMNKGSITYGDTDMNAIFFGGSWRVGRRTRLIGEFVHVAEKKGLFDANGFGTNTFSFAYGWFGRKTALNLGLMLTETAFSNCGFGPLPCDTERLTFVPVPVISTSIHIGKK